MNRANSTSNGEPPVADDLDSLFAQLEAELTVAEPTAAAAPVLATSAPASEAATFVPAVEAAPPATPPVEPMQEAAPATADPEDLRDAPRLTPEELAREVRVTVRGASEAKAINVSETGVLAETTSRLRPGSVVELILTFDGVRKMLRATIVRSMVHSLNPTIFRTAFQFEEPTTFPERQ